MSTLLFLLLSNRTYNSARAGLTALPGSNKQMLERIMNFYRHITAILALTLFVVSCDREDAACVTGRLIRFSAESEWPELAKAPVTGSNPINEFRVWGQWHPDPDDDSYYVYDDIVFGESGAIVTDGQSGWVCEDEKEWFKGYYNFAAVHPSDFSGSNSPSFVKSATSLKYTNILTLDPGEDGFSLSCTDATKDQQPDLMYAFDNQDNSLDQASYVSLRFHHAFSLLTIRLAMSAGTFAQNSIFVRKVAVYGIHDTLYGQMKFKQVVTTDSSGNTLPEEKITDNIAALLPEARVSTEQNPFYTAQYELYKGFQYNLTSIDLVENLLVFPETLSQHVSLKVQIELQCVNNANPGIKEMYAEITKGEWNPGSNNVYVLQVDPAIFAGE